MASIDERPEAKPEEKARVVYKLAEDLELRADGVVRRRGGTRAARPEDVPKRRDLPRDHPLYGQRVLRVVPCGMSDCVVGDDGRLAPVGGKADDEELEERYVRR